jgi:hypothetical protein
MEKTAMRYGRLGGVCSFMIHSRELMKRRNTIVVGLGETIREIGRVVVRGWI